MLAAFRGGDKIKLRSLIMRIAIEISDDKHRAFKDYANGNNTTMSIILRSYIDNLLDYVAAEDNSLDAVMTEMDMMEQSALADEGMSITKEV